MTNTTKTWANRAAQSLLTTVENGRMSSIAYDTAWMARLRRPDGTHRFPRAFAWLLDHQHPDGSWGAHFPTPQDRLISTLAAVLALAGAPQDPGVAMATARGRAGLAKWSANLNDPRFETIGFELILPMLLDDALRRGIELPDRDFSPVRELRDAKLSLAPKDWAYRPGSPLTHSLEYLGPHLDIGQARRVIADNGSVANSPSASAYLAGYIKDAALSGYLNRVSTSEDGGIPNVQPFELFERAWCLYSFDLAGLSVPAMTEARRSLQWAWRESGVGISVTGLHSDADDTAMVYAGLCPTARTPGALAVFEQFRMETGYRCFPYERNPSVSANIHIVEAMARVSGPEADRIRSHATQFLLDARKDGALWEDKWHVSPYYTTTHAMVALHRTHPEVIPSALDWIRSTQHADGGWGIFGGTREETAYVVQAVAHLTTGRASASDQAALRKAGQYLREAPPRYPELWVGKGLYAPIAVVDAAIVGAVAQLNEFAKPSDPFPELHSLARGKETAER